MPDDFAPSSVPEVSPSPGVALAAPPYTYKAFISYSHTADSQLAPSLQLALERFAKPLFRMRNFRIFRDTTNLAITPELWPEIEKALGQSAHLLLMASEEAAGSKWVKKELTCWLGHKGPGQLFLILTSGRIVWDDKAGDFDWGQTTALPDVLKGTFASEPLYLDFSGFRAGKLSLDDEGFLDHVATLAAALHGRSKDEIFGEHIRQHRWTLRLAWSAALVLVMLLVGVTIAGLAAYNAYTIAEKRRREALSRQLAAQAEMIRTQQPEQLERSMLLALESMRRAPSAEAERTLRLGMALLPPLVSQMKHKGDVVDVAFGPQGRYLATASEDHTAAVWDIPDGHQLVRVHHDGKVNAVAMSPDGGYFATASDDKTAAIWEVKTGRERARVKHDRAVRTAEFSPDGTYLATQTDRQIVRVLTVPTGRVVAQFGNQRGSVLSPHDSPTTAFHPKSSLLATANESGAVRLWEIATGREVAQFDHAADLLAFSPDGRWLATVGKYPNIVVRVWDVATHKEISRFSPERGVSRVIFCPHSRLLAAVSGEIWIGPYPPGVEVQNFVSVWDVSSASVVSRLNHPDRVVDLAPSPDGHRIVTACVDGIARLWNIPSGEEVARMTHQDRVLSVAISADGALISTASRDQTARVWQARAGLELARIAHDDSTSGTRAFAFSGIRAFAFRPDGRVLATASGDGTARLWDVSTSRELARLQHGDGANVVVYSPNGQYVATGGQDRTARIWDADGHHLLVAIDHKDEIMSLSFSPDGRLLASGNGSGYVRLIEVPAGRELACMHHKTRAGIVRFSPDGQYVAAARGQGVTGVYSVIEAENEVWVWKVPATKEPLRIAHEFTGEPWENWKSAITDLAFSPDGRYLATASEDHTARIWSLPGGRQLTRLSHGEQVSTVCFSPEGRYLATTSAPGPVRMWDVLTSEQVWEAASPSSFRRVCFSPDGKYVAGANGLVWETRTGRQVADIPQAQDSTEVLFSPDGNYLATSNLNILRIWAWRREDLLAEACRRLTRNLSQHEWTQYLHEEPYQPTCPDLSVHRSSEARK